MDIDRETKKKLFNLIDKQSKLHYKYDTIINHLKTHKIRSKTDQIIYINRAQKYHNQIVALDIQIKAIYPNIELGFELSSVTSSEEE